MAVAAAVAAPGCSQLGSARGEAIAEIDEMVNTRAARFARADEMSVELEEASDR